MNKLFDLKITLERELSVYKTLLESGENSRSLINCNFSATEIRLSTITNNVNIGIKDFNEKCATIFNMSDIVNWQIYSYT